MPINPAIALGVQPLQLADPLSQYAKFASIQQAQNQNALAQYQLDAARREQASQNALNEAYRAAYDPQTGAIDMNRLRQTLSTGGFGSKLPGIEKSMAEVETKRAQEAKAKTDLVDAKLKQSRGFLDTIDPADPTAPEKFIAWHEANHRDPVLGPVLAARGITADQSRARIAQAIQQGPQAFAQLLMQSKLGTEKFIEMNKPTTQVIDQSGQRQVIQLPGLGGAPTTVGTYAAVPLPPDVEAQKARVAKAGATSLNVGLSTERKYSEQFAGNVAKADEALLSAAQNAPSAAENANRILTTLASGKAITGPLADVKLNIARALNVAGADNADMISKTESLVASMAENTLNAIKTSGLGTGQGFTNKDLEFLEKAKSGNINFQPDTIRQLAELAHRAAEKTAEKWSNRVKQIPKSALEGTGVSTEPITVPKRASSVTATARPSGVGPDWTLMQDANGRKAWVSPDGKQHKEVQ